MNNMKITSGIDFGTSNSTVAFSDNGEVKNVRIENKNYSIPTALFFYADSNRKIFGNNAIDAFLRHENGRLVQSIKTILGTSLMDEVVWINNRHVYLISIIEYFITHLKYRLDEQAGTPVDSVVVGRPVKFNVDDEVLDNQAEDIMRNIAIKSGFRFVEFQFEPVAAAFSHEQNIAGEKLAIVIDIGGGTSDFSVIKLGDQLKNKTDRKDDILANTGVKIGGNILDKNFCLSYFMPHLGRGTTLGSRNLPMPDHLYYELSDWNGINYIYNSRTNRLLKELYTEANDPVKVSRLVSLVTKKRAHELLGIVEQTKIKLTLAESAQSILTAVHDKPSVTVNRSDFDNSSGKIFEMINCSLNECLVQAGKKSPDIDIVILTGGSTEIIWLRETIQKQFPNAFISDKNRFLSVCEGLVYDAMRKFSLST